MPQQPAQARSHHQSHLSRGVGQTSPRPRSSMFPFEMMMLKKCEINFLAKLPSWGRRFTLGSWDNTQSQAGPESTFWVEWLTRPPLWPAAGRHTYSELGRVGLSTSRSGSLEFMLGCKLLLELRMLFAFEETTDSKLELMRLFLCSSGGDKNPQTPY